MKLLIASLVALVLTPGGGPSVGFESEGVRVGDAVVTDVVLQLKDGGSGMLLASRSVVEPLGTELSIALAADRTLVLEPGIRVSRVEFGFELTSRHLRRLEVEVSGEKTVLMTPVPVEVTGKGWKVAGREAEGATLAARRVAQDAVDKDLDAMNKSSRKVGTRVAGQRRPPFWYFNYRSALGEAFSRNALALLAHSSPSGF